MKVSDIYPATKRLLMGRSVSNDFLAEYIRKGALELSEGYKFAGLQKTGPTVQFTQFQNNYDPNYFKDPTDANLEVNKINSFYLYLSSDSPPSVSSTVVTSAGYNLVFKTIDVLEVLINVAGVPMYWTRHEGLIWIASCPDRTYYTYARYQKEHPFPHAGVHDDGITHPNAGDDPLYFPNSWQDIIEYQSAMRAAQELNLSTKVSEFNQRLNGDAQFQKTGGLEGQPGLIFQRTSQENRDQSTSRKSFRLRMGRV